MSYPDVLDRWAAAVTRALGLSETPRGETAIDIEAILDLAGDAAHHVARPAAPVTAYLLGMAVGMGKGDPEELTARLSAAAKDFHKETGHGADS